MKLVESPGCRRDRDLLARYAVLRAGGQIGELQSFGAELVSTILDSYFNRAGYRRDAVEALCKIATESDSSVRKIGAAAIFSDLVETLSDAFTPHAVVLYDTIFAQIIEFCRHLPSGKALDFQLNRFGIENE